MRSEHRVVLVTNLFPTPARPHRGIFVERQVTAMNRLLREPVRVVLVGRTGAGGWLASRRAVREIVATDRPDIVHVYYGASGAVVPLGLAQPIVLTLCGSDILRWGTRHDFRGLVEYAVSWVTAARAQAVVVQSKPVRDALGAQALKSKVIVVPTGIDLTTFVPRDRTRCRVRLGWPVDEPVILFPADPRRPEKQFLLAEASVARLVSSHPRRIALRVLRDVAPDSVVDHLNAADCVLLTSAWEAGPIVLAEALACGIPVVSTPVGYAAEGALLPQLQVVPPDVESLAEAVGRVLDDPPPRMRPVPWGVPSDHEYARRVIQIYDRVAATF